MLLWHVHMPDVFDLPSSSLSDFQAIPIRVTGKHLSLPGTITRRAGERRPDSMNMVKAELRTIAAGVASGLFMSIKPTPVVQPAAGATKKSVQVSPPVPPPPPVRSPSCGTLRTRHDSKGRSVRSVAWPPDSTLLASVGESNVIDVWDAENGNTVRTYQEHRENVRAVAWSPDGTYIASSSSNSSLQRKCRNDPRKCRTILRK